MINSNDVILITGGTGFTGVHLVKALCETGATIRVIARASSNRGELEDLPIEWYTGCLLYTSPSPRDRTRSRMPSSA